jgi:hypothetical protein
MVYKRNTPALALTDIVGESGRQFRENFRKVDDYYKPEHVPLNSDQTTSIGAHNRTTLPDQSGDPTTAASEMAMYCNGSPPALYVRDESDGDIVKMTSNKFLANGLKLEAFICFDSAGNVLSVKRPGVDEDGNEIEEEIELRSSNATVSIPAPSLTEYLITFSPAISTANYFPVIQQFVKPARQAFVQIQNGNTYADSVTASSLKLRGYLYVPGNGIAPIDSFPRIVVQIYTVA